LAHLSQPPLPIRHPVSPPAAPAPSLNAEQSHDRRRRRAPAGRRGAGSGKTNTLAHRVARLILAGRRSPAHPAADVFAAAANEMTQRAAACCSASWARAARPWATLPWAGTFHSIGARLLREYAGRHRPGRIVHHPRPRRFRRPDGPGAPRDRADGRRQKRFPLKGTCLAIYSRVVNSREPLDLVLQSTFPWCSEWEDELKRLFGAYVDAKQEQNVLDYDDLLLFWAEMASDPELGPELGALFDHVLVDEYQDTNRLQAAILPA
jgi:DNA helicase-2/ATP-dependent DNA helicase PcrA